MFFRAKDLTALLTCSGAAFGLGGGPACADAGADGGHSRRWSGMLVEHFALRERGFEDWAPRAGGLLIGHWVVLCFSILLAQGTGDAFIYFQF